MALSYFEKFKYNNKLIDIELEELTKQLDNLETSIHEDTQDLIIRIN